MDTFEKIYNLVTQPIKIFLYDVFEPFWSYLVRHFWISITLVFVIPLLLNLLISG